MATVSLDIDDRVLALVQQHARETGTTVEEIIAEHLKGVAWEISPERAELAARARKRLAKLSETSPARMGSWKWNREGAYEGRLFGRNVATRDEGQE